MTQAVTNSPPGQAEPEATKSVSKTRRAVEVYSEAQERLNDALDKLQHHASDRLGRAVDYVAAQLEGQLLRLNADDQITGLPAEFMQRCFAEFCQRGHGRELSRRQRSAYVEPFNLICEQVQPYLMVTLTPVKNYLRGPRPLPVQPRFIVHVRPSTYDKLMIALLADVFSREAATPETWFLRVALLMVLRIGVTFTGCLQALCWVRRCDLYPDHRCCHIAQSERAAPCAPQAAGLSESALSACRCPTGYINRGHPPDPLCHDRSRSLSQRCDRRAEWPYDQQRVAAQSHPG